ncbi:MULTISPECIES: hypothetical protein [Methylococcus]|jgi:putative transposase|uniref:hypothetical protein n=1 Tax=Methylococcus TaxID=413 RepID=UPI00211AD6F2|nr:hypothetical protein [Methylococcus capsulatus]
MAAKKRKGALALSTVERSDTLWRNLLDIEADTATLTMGQGGGLRGVASIREKDPTLQAFSGDSGYRGTAVRLVDETLGLTLYNSEQIHAGFAVLPKRWGHSAELRTSVERTFAWLGAFR